jgi:hypothetical protein
MALGSARGQCKLLSPPAAGLARAPLVPFGAAKIGNPIAAGRVLMVLSAGDLAGAGAGMIRHKFNGNWEVLA